MAPLFRASGRARNKKSSRTSYRKVLWFRPRLEHLEDRTLLSAPGGVLDVISSGVNALAPPTDPRGQSPPPNGPTHLGTVQPPAASTKSSGTIIGLDSGTAVQPPSLFQGMLSLYLDGAFLEAVNVANQFLAANPDEYNLVSSVTTNRVVAQ
jgi:hypothetical protein